MKPRLLDHWRISTFRLAFMFGVLFTIGNVALLGLIYWQTSAYLQKRTDDSIAGMASNFQNLSPERIREEVQEVVVYDLRRSNLYGLFAADGAVIAGNMKHLPDNLPPDNQIHQFAQPSIPPYPSAAYPTEPGQARAMVQRLSNGNILIVGRDFTQLAEIKAIILNAILISGALILFVGLLSGFLLSRGPLRRIHVIRAASRRIMQGELSLRLPVTARQDELDILSAIINTMLEEIERLLNEVKSVTDTVAHDLRTPLTRLRLLLQKLQQQLAQDPEQSRLMDNALEETDALLARFRALLRISEIENRQRKSGFQMVDIDAILAQLLDLFEPMAEDAGVRLTLQTVSLPAIWGDPELLFEALCNLVDNAIKFTPRGGAVLIRTSLQDDAGCIEVIDTGCGVGQDEREAVLLRFHRSPSGKPMHGRPGFGLGLSIVAAIVRLHGFTLTFQDAPIGTHLLLRCPLLEPTAEN